MYKGLCMFFYYYWLPTYVGIIFQNGIKCFDLTTSTAISTTTAFVRHHSTATATATNFATPTLTATALSNATATATSPPPPFDHHCYHLCHCNAAATNATIIATSTIAAVVNTATIAPADAAADAGASTTATIHCLLCLIESLLYQCSVWFTKLILS